MDEVLNMLTDMCLESSIDVSSKQAVATTKKDFHEHVEIPTS